MKRTTARVAARDGAVEMKMFAATERTGMACLSVFKSLDIPHLSDINNLEQFDHPSNWQNMAAGC